MPSTQFKITGSIIQAYIMCPRQSWLMSRNISGDQYNDFLAIGRLLSEESYSRDKKEIHIEGNVFDVIKKENNMLILIETKKSSKHLEAGKFQLLYYIYSLKEKIPNMKAEIRVPKEKLIFDVELNEENEHNLLSTIGLIQALIEKEKPMNPEKKKYCKTCSYNEFCWS
jgi:CRISPR-associated exonuclease Cas4